MTTSGPDRMPPIPAEKRTDAQKRAAEEFADVRKQEVFGPFAALLRSPEVMLRAAAMGDYLRYRTVLPPTLNEFAIILTARRWTQHYEWNLHAAIALKAGLSGDIVKAIADGRRPDDMSDEEEIVHDLCTELFRDESVSDATYARAVARFGEQGVVELVGVAGYYTFLSFVMNTARTATEPNPAVPPLVRLTK